MAQRFPAPRSRKSRPVEDVDEQTSQNLPDQEILDPEMPPQMAFFDRLRKIPAIDWGHMQVFVYRLDPKVRNAGPYKYIDIFSGPFDESDIAQRHGGGKYQCLLKDQDTQGLVAKCTFEVAGAPKLYQSQTVLDDKGNEVPIAPAPPQQSPAESGMVEVLKQLVTALEAKKVPADEAIKNAMETLSQAQRGALDIVMQAAKANATTTTGHPMMDKLMERFLERMSAGEEKKTNPIAEFREMLTTVRELQGLSVDPSSGKKPSFLDEARGLAEILKVDTDGSLRSLLFGKGEIDEAPVTGMAAAFKFFGSAIERKPEILDYLTRGLGALVDRLSTPAAPGHVQPTVIRQVSPSLSGPATAATSVTTGNPPNSIQPSAPITTPSQSVPPQAVIDGILQAVLNGYQAQYDGSAVANSIAVLYPGAIPLLQEYLQMNDSMVMMWLRTQPVLAPIVNNEDFPEFFMDFKKGVLIEAQGDVELDSVSPSLQQTPAGTATVS